MPEPEGQAEDLRGPPRSRTITAAATEEYEKMRRRVGLLFEDPGSSWLAWFLSLFILACILVSCAAVLLETVPEYEALGPAFWLQLELFFVVVFSLEYGLRFWATDQRKIDFFFDSYNLFDFLAIFPFYLELAVLGASYMLQSDVELDLGIVRLLRLFRIFKLAKYSRSMQMILTSLNAAKSSLIFLLGFLLVALAFFGALMYVFEQGRWDSSRQCHVRPGESSCSPFESIPQTFYWGITTMTTVGYGDVLPITPAGKFVSGLSMMFGIVVIALPVTMIANAFSGSYEEVGTELRKHAIQLKVPEMSKADQELVEIGLELDRVTRELPIALHQLQVSAAEMLLVNKDASTPEEALQHWNTYVGFPAECVTQGLVNLRKFAKVLKPDCVA